MSEDNRSGRGDLPEPADEHDRQLLADVEQHGLHVIGVEEDEEGPGFAYSIGLYHSFDHPEVIVFGLPVRVMHPIINGIGEQVRAGKRLGHLDESGMSSTATMSASARSSGGTTANTSATPAGSTGATTSRACNASGRIPSTATPGTRRPVRTSLAGSRFCPTIRPGRSTRARTGRRSRPGPSWRTICRSSW